MTVDIIKLPLTRGEAHAVLRALASYANNDLYDEGNPDRAKCRWVAQRLLQIIDPSLGTKPIEGIIEKGEGT